MSHLKALKLANAEPARPSSDPVERARETVIAALSEQKAMAQAKIAGTEYIAVHIVTRKDAEGNRVRVEAKKRLRPGWFTDKTGKTFFALRYAGKAIEFAKDKNAVEIGEFGALPTVLDTLREATHAGELDQQLLAAMNARKATRRKVS